MMVEMMDVLSGMIATQNLQLLILTPENYEDLSLMDLGLRQWITPNPDWKSSFDILQKQLPDATLLYTRDVFELNYAQFRLPDNGNIVSIGPWLTESVDAEVLSWPRDMCFLERLPEIRHFYHSIRILDPNDLENGLSALISCFFPDCRLSIHHMKEELPFTYTPVRPPYPQPIFWNSLTIESMEQRWRAREKLLRAVREAKTKEALSLFRQQKDFRFFRSPIGAYYTDKMELLMANSLFMEVAGQALVHPVYSQEVFDTFSNRIISLRNAEYSPIIREMIEEYCNCIQRWSLAQYSEPVRIAIDTMRFQLKETPTPSMLAAKSGLSLRQLNRRFRQETGMTMMEYLGKERIRAACIALEISDQSIGQVAESVGIIDANYFSRLFKKYMGQTPSQYRKNLFKPQIPH